MCDRQTMVWDQDSVLLVCSRVKPTGFQARGKAWSVDGQGEP